MIFDDQYTHFTTPLGQVRMEKVARMGDVLVVKKNFFRSCGVHNSTANGAPIIYVFDRVGSSGLWYPSDCRSRAAGVGAGHPGSLKYAASANCNQSNGKSLYQENS